MTWSNGDTAQSPFGRRDWWKALISHEHHCHVCVPGVSREIMIDKRCIAAVRVLNEMIMNKAYLTCSEQPEMSLPAVKQMLSMKSPPTQWDMDARQG